MSTSTSSASAKKTAAQPILDGKQPRAQSLVVHVFVVLPMLALVAAVPLAWGWGIMLGGLLAAMARSASGEGVAQRP